MGCVSRIFDFGSRYLVETANKIFDLTQAASELLSSAASCKVNTSKLQPGKLSLSPHKTCAAFPIGRTSTTFNRYYEFGRRGVPGYIDHFGGTMSTGTCSPRWAEVKS